MRGNWAMRSLVGAYNDSLGEGDSWIESILRLEVSRISLQFHLNLKCSERLG